MERSKLKVILAHTAEEMETLLKQDPGSLRFALFDVGNPPVGRVHYFFPDPAAHTRSTEAIIKGLAQAVRTLPEPAKSLEGWAMYVAHLLGQELQA